MNYSIGIPTGSSAVRNALLLLIHNSIVDDLCFDQAVAELILGPKSNMLLKDNSRDLVKVSKLIKSACARAKFPLKP